MANEQLVSKVWSYAHELRGQAISCARKAFFAVAKAAMRLRLPCHGR